MEQRCYNRNINKNPLDANDYTSCIHANPEGKCEYYEKSLLTRILRFFGLREAVSL